MKGPNREYENKDTYDWDADDHEDYQDDCADRDESASDDDDPE